MHKILHFFPEDALRSKTVGQVNEWIVEVPALHGGSQELTAEKVRVSKPGVQGAAHVVVSYYIDLLAQVAAFGCGVGRYRNRSTARVHRVVSRRQPEIDIRLPQLPAPSDGLFDAGANLLDVFSS